MAELIQVVEPTEKSYDIRLTESEVSALLFLMDFASNDAIITYKAYSAGRVYSKFKPKFKELVTGIDNAMIECTGYTHADDYME